MDQQGIHHHLFGIEDAGRLVWLNSVEVSPDGTMFAVGITERDVPNNTLADAFYVISEAGEHLHYVAGSSPVFSPDGHHIAFEANGACISIISFPRIAGCLLLFIPLSISWAIWQIKIWLGRPIQNV